MKDKSTAKNDYRPWKGPYYVVQHLSDCLYKIQADGEHQGFVVHHNQLKRAHLREPRDTSWISAQAPILEIEGPDNIPPPGTNNGRPKREVHQPDRLGEWLYKY